MGIDLECDHKLDMYYLCPYFIYGFKGFILVFFLHNEFSINSWAFGKK